MEVESWLQADKPEHTHTHTQSQAAHQPSLHLGWIVYQRIKSDAEHDFNFDVSLSSF